MKRKSIEIHAEGNIDIHQRKKKFQDALRNLESDKTIIRENKKVIITFINDCTLGKTVLGKSKKKIGPARCLKYISILKQISKSFGKSFNAITQKDMEQFINKLENDDIKTKRKNPYSEETKADIKKTIKKFWKWKDGNNKIYPEIVDWIDTYVSVRDISALSRAEIEKMIDLTSNPRNRALIMVLFDSGARISELLNVRLKKEHVFWKDELGCYMIRLEYSKTKPRTISLPLSTKYLSEWLALHPAKENSQAQLFPISYANLKMIIGRIGLRVLGKRVTPHMLRHSSATYYANKIKNPYKLCYRYGWAMASKEVNRYLDREGILEEETPDLVKTDELSKFHKRNESLKEELSLIKDSNSTLQAEVDNLKDRLNAIMGGKGFMTFLFGLVKQQKEMAEALEKISGRKLNLKLSDMRI